MLNKILRPFARRAFQRGVQKRFDHHGHSNFKYVTFDEACVPQGSWQEGYSKQQARFNTHLIAGLTVFGLTIGSIAKFELLFFNYLPPKPKE